MRKTIFVLSTWCIALLCIFLFYREANHSDEPLNLRMVMDYISSYNGFEAFQSIIYGLTITLNDLNEALSAIFDFEGILETLADIGLYIGSAFKGLGYLLLCLVEALLFIFDSLWWVLGFFELLI